MVNTSRGITLDDAVGQFLASLSAETTAADATELKRFVSWFHGEKAMQSFTPLEIAAYSERFSASDTEQAHKLEILRKFLTYARKEGWTDGNLSVNLKGRREVAKPASKASIEQAQSDMGILTQQGYDDIQRELAALKGQRPRVLEDIRRAAADKDFRENAPLHAAREQLGHIDGRIQELEAITKSATIIDRSEHARSRIALGNTVTLEAVESGKVQRYTIVGPKESDPLGGKISHVSPIGRAVIGKKQGDVIEVDVPAGRVSYRINKVEN